ncbi:hypothetical protein ACVWXL_009237 [Bradyrhizobium sp. GM22.5]
MAEISPLRRRMIEGMTVRNLSPATQQSYLNAVAKLSDISVVLRTALTWRISVPSRFIWLRRGCPGQGSTRSSAP